MSLFRDGVQFCSGLVDLVVCVRRYGGGSHRLALAGERFVGLVAEDIAEMLDRGGESGERGCGQELDAKPAMVAAGSWRVSRWRSIASTDSAGRDTRGVTRIVVATDGHSGVFERGPRAPCLASSRRTKGWAPHYWPQVLAICAPNTFLPWTRLAHTTPGVAHDNLRCRRSRQRSVRAVPVRAHWEQEWLR